MQFTDASHGTDDPTPSAAGGVGDGLDSEAKGEDLDPDSSLEASNTEAVHCSMVEDGGTGEVSVHLVTQPHGISSEGHVTSADPVHIIADRVPEDPSASGSKTTLKSNQSGKASGRQRSKKQRQIGSVKMPEVRSPPSQSMKPYDDNYDEMSSEDNENKYSATKQSKRTPATTDSTTARRQLQKGDGERSNGTPSRRLAFAPVPASELNRRMGNTPNQTPEKYTPTKNVIQVVATEEESVSPILSLQQAGSNTGQVVAIGDESDPESEDAENYISGSAIRYSEEESIEAALHRQYVQQYGEDDFEVHHDSDEHHDSDKENVPVREVFRPGFNTPRRPLQTLYSAPSPPMYQSPDSFTTPTASQKLSRARYQARRQWQMVVDSDCLLNRESFAYLKQLEGIREARLVIPSIVVRELDVLQKQNDSKDRASAALQWINACMSKKPSERWIHVQSSGEFVHVAITPPVSPSLYRGPHPYVSESDMMSLSPHDHVLECALFQQTKPDGRVAILTDDTTLRIKALAESLVVDTAINFCDSLLNPYSDRFVYVGSTPIERSSIGRQHEKVNDGLSTPGTAISSSKWPTPAVARSLSRQDTPRPSSRANFSIWRKSQPLGLQALL